MTIDHQISITETSMQWDLTSVAVVAEEVEAEVDAACRRFAGRYRGRIGALGPEELAEALAELGRIRGALVHLTGVARLRVAENLDGAAERAASAKADAVAAGAEELLRFFELEWLALPDSRVEETCAASPLAAVAPLLRSIRRFAPHVLSEAEERALEPHADLVAHCYDTVVADRLAVDELRGYRSPRAERDLENELRAEVVDTMIGELDAHTGLVRRWYERKAELLGLPRLAISDEHAPLGAAEEIPFAEARATIEDTFADLEPELGDLA